MCKSREQRLTTKEHIAMHIHLYSSTLVIKVQTSYCNTIRPVFFYKRQTCMVRPLLKLKCSVLLVMYNWLNGFYCEMNDKLLFFGSNSLLGPRLNIINSKCHANKLKCSRSCLIGYSDFVSFNSLGDGYTDTHTHTDFPGKSNFKKPGDRLAQKHCYVP